MRRIKKEPKAKKADRKRKTDWGLIGFKVSYDKKGKRKEERING